MLHEIRNTSIFTWCYKSKHAHVEKIIIILRQSTKTFKNCAANCNNLKKCFAIVISGLFHYLEQKNDNVKDKHDKVLCGESDCSGFFYRSFRNFEIFEGSNFIVKDPYRFSESIELKLSWTFVLSIGKRLSFILNRLVELSARNHMILG